jgi:ABC-2 type transport system permease protein
VFNQIKDRYRYSIILLKQLIKTDFKLRYQGSFLGYLWSLLRPLALFAILYFIFVEFLKFGGDIPHFPVYLLLGIVLWNYFIEVTTGSIAAIVGRGDLMRKINFPKYVIVLAGSFSALINLAINFAVIAVFMFFNHVDIRMAVLVLPIIVLELFVFALALAFFLSTAFVRFRDVSYIWEVLMQGAFYATPILYALSEIPVKAAKILMLNPMAQIIQDARFVLITPQTVRINDLYGSQIIRIVPIGIVIVCAVWATLYFRKQSKYFAEDV